MSRSNFPGANFTVQTHPLGGGGPYAHNDSFDFSHTAEKLAERIEHVQDRLDLAASRGHDVVQHFLDGHPLLAQFIEENGLHISHNAPWFGHDDWAT